MQLGAVSGRRHCENAHSILVPAWRPQQLPLLGREAARQRPLCVCGVAASNQQTIYEGESVGTERPFPGLLVSLTKPLPSQMGIAVSHNQGLAGVAEIGGLDSLGPSAPRFSA